MNTAKTFKTSKLLLASTFALLAAAPAWAQQALVADRSEIKFTANQLGVNVAGEFKEFSAEVQLDPRNLDASRIKLTVATGSATMHNPEADANLPQAVWFNVAQFPQASFESTRIRALADGKYEAEGKLTIKGVSSDVVVPVTLVQSGELTTASGSLPIKRLTYKVGDGEWSDTSMVADEVRIDFKLALSGIDKP